MGIDPFLISIDTTKMALGSESEIKLHFAALQLALQELERMVLATRDGDEYAADGLACDSLEEANNWNRLAQSCYERAEAHRELALTYGNWGNREEVPQ